MAPPKVDWGAGEAAIDAYDDDGDGAISGPELDRAPALKASSQRLDGNGDGKITADEIKARVNAWRASNVALSRLIFAVRCDGRPLPHAQVTIVPEEFLGPAIKLARGQTDQRGMVNLKISENPDESGVHFGFYRIEISKKAGQHETIPARYNTQTELGIEVATDDPSAQGVLTVDISRR